MYTAHADVQRICMVNGIWALYTITTILQVAVVVVQVAFVDPPELDFDLQLPSDSHGSGLLDYVEGWADAFITDSILSQYVLPDHYFSQIDSVGCRTSAADTALLCSGLLVNCCCKVLAQADISQCVCLLLDMLVKACIPGSYLYILVGILLWDVFIMSLTFLQNLFSITPKP